MFGGCPGVADPEDPKCQCPNGTIHDAATTTNPCCNGADCACQVVTKPANFFDVDTTNSLTTAMRQQAKASYDIIWNSGNSERQLILDLYNSHYMPIYFDYNSISKPDTIEYDIDKSHYIVIRGNPEMSDYARLIKDALIEYKNDPVTKKPVSLNKQTDRLADSAQKSIKPSTPWTAFGKSQAIRMAEHG